MSKPLAASKKVMQNYLSELMTDESVEPAPISEKEQQLDKLLQNVATPQAELPPRALSRKSKTALKTKVKTAKVAEPEKVLPAVEIQAKALVDEPPLRTRKSEGPLTAATHASYRKGSFQALFFEVAGLVIAVPLIELGGIHNMVKTNVLMGKPPWFKGVMIHREEQINVVDTALWVMPEKCDQKLKELLNITTY